MQNPRNTSLNLLYYPFRIRLLRGHEIAINKGIPVRFFETYRSRERQTELYSLGRDTAGDIVTNAGPGFSYHQYGLATDLVMYSRSGWDWQSMHHYRALVPVMESVGLTGLYNRGDWPHWQLSGLPPVHQLNAIYSKHGLEGVWALLDKQYG